MPENFAIAQKILERLVKTRPFKFQYSYSSLKDISPGDIEDIITIFLEIKEQEEQAKIKTPSDSAIELTDEEKQALEMIKEIEKQAETKAAAKLELTDEENKVLERMDQMIEEIKLNKKRYLRLLAYEKGFIKNSKGEKK